MPGGILGLDTGDGNFDIWGISTDYYPSHPTAGNAWGLRWNGNNNDFEFVGGGTSRVILDMDGGNVTATGTLSASNFSGTSSGTNTGDQTNISGNSATSTVAYNLQAADATQIRFNSVINTDYSTMTFMSRAWSAVQGANGLAYNFTTHTNAGGGGYGALQIYYGESGYVLAPTSFRAPIFYDSNDTAYYLDPNNTSFSANLSGTLRLQTGAFGTNSVSSSSQATLSRTFAPQGASNGFNGGGITAAIKIRLPFRGNDCMWSMKVRIYNYSNDQVSEYTIGNYSYSAGAYHRAAYFMGGLSAIPQAVRFGNDGTYDCVWIGETSTSWSYPQVSVMDFQGGYVRSDVATVSNNWNVTFVTSFDTVAANITPSIRFSDTYATTFRASVDMRSPIYYDSNDTAKYLQRNTSTYTSWFMGGSNNSYSGWNVDGSMHLMMHTSGVGAPCGFYHQNQGWSALFYVNAAQYLYHAASEKFRTASDGIVVTGTVYATGDVIAYYSDIRLKKDVTIIDSALDKIQKLRGVTYTWNDEEVNVVKNRAGTRDIGLIAQEVEAVEPLLITEYQTALDEAPKTAEGAADFNPRMSETYKTIKYDKLVALLVEAVKEQQTQIENQNQEIQNLKALVGSLLGKSLK